MRPSAWPPTGWWGDNTMRRALLLVLLLLVGCAQASPTAPASADLDAARQTLIDFFDYVADGDYAAAVALHAENADFYQFNRENNPDVNPDDRAALMQAACERQLLCMAVKHILSEEQLSDSQFLFVVEFANPDGSIFVMGPCCGADETEMPPNSEFEYRVEKSADDFRVLGGPLYVP